MQEKNPQEKAAAELNFSSMQWKEPRRMAAYG